jgi:hypothetical protein
MDDEQKIRKFESEVLDKAHVNYAFYQYSEDIVIPYLLQVYGDTERHRANLIATGCNTITQSIVVKYLFLNTRMKKAVL